MTDKEKLIEILQYGMDKYFLLKFEAEIFANLLIDNGVTFATDTNVGSKWISVEDELPEATYQVLTVDDEEWIEIDALGSEDWLSRRNVTHWMPMPEPPKET